jgi:hypothetical protein
VDWVPVFFILFSRWLSRHSSEFSDAKPSSHEEEFHSSFFCFQKGVFEVQEVTRISARDQFFQLQ